MKKYFVGVRNSDKQLYHIVFATRTLTTAKFLRFIVRPFFNETDISPIKDVCIRKEPNMRIDKNSGIVCDKCKRHFNNPLDYVTLKPFKTEPATDYYTHEVKYDVNTHLCLDCYDKFIQWTMKKES